MKMIDKNTLQVDGNLNPFEVATLLLKQPDPVIKPKDEAQRILYRAIDILENIGWTQDIMFEAQNDLLHSVCALGAIRAAQNRLENVEDSHEERLAVYRLHKAIGSREQITKWNDDDQRTYDEVLAAFRLATTL